MNQFGTKSPRFARPFGAHLLGGALREGRRGVEAKRLKENELSWQI